MGEAMVSGEGWISDDSSFYGDEDIQERLSSLCDDFQPKPFWSTHKKDLNVVVAKQQLMPPPKLFNPGEGRPDSWQLCESADDFVKRLPPLTTSRTFCDWIWVQNPHPRGQGKAAPSNDAEFVSRGSALLAQSLQARNDIQTKTKGTITRGLSDESKLLQQRITDLAVETNLLSGKWMLFPEPENVTRTWRLIVDAVINNRLGLTAKVSPDEGKPGSRLICVYTKDFRDKADVLRILKELVSMGLAGTDRPLYYKSDPYTLLGIYQNNATELGLQASLYSSQKMLAEATLAKATITPQRKQSTLEGCYGSYDPMDID